MMTTGFYEIEFEAILFLEKCGGGTFGSVYRAIWKTFEMEVAVKKLLVLDKEVGLSMKFIKISTTSSIA